MPGSTVRGLACAAVAVWVASAPPLVRAAEVRVEPVEIVEMKAVFGRVETRDLVPARARIGGTLVSLDVTEGSGVTVGQRIATVTDDKLALQLNAADARIKALESELGNARTELGRASELLARGSGTLQRVDQLRTQTEVLTNQMNAARAERAVIAQQASEGEVLSPATGRVLKVPVTRGAVILPGEAVATIAGGGFFLRLAIPERHAPLLAEGASVRVDARQKDAGSPSREGRIVKVFPQIEGGRVIADVEVPGLGDFFVGERLLVRVPVSTRRALAVPPSAVSTRSGIDFVTVAGPDGPRAVAVIPGRMVDTAQGARREILTGLLAGDRIVVP